MIVKVNGTSVQNLNQVQERKNREDEIIVSLIFHNSIDTVSELKQLFSNITTLFIERTDLEGNTFNLDYSDYNQLLNVERTISDEADITTVKLESAKQ